MSAQPEALMALADRIEEANGQPIAIDPQAAAELRRLHAENEGLKRRVETSAQALRQWLDKTEWIQETGHGSELGLHRADAVRQRLEKTEAQRDALLEFAKYVEAIDPNNPAPLFQQARAAIKAVEGEGA